MGYNRLGSRNLSKAEAVAARVRPLPGVEPPRPKKVLTEYSLADACNKHGYSLQQIDAMVRFKTAELFRKAGVVYVRIL